MPSAAADMQAFTPIVTMVALFIAQLEAPTSRLISAVFLIALGTAVASYGEVSFSLVGVLYMFSSESFEAIRLVMTQMLLVGLKLHPSVHPPLSILSSANTPCCYPCMSRLHTSCIPSDVLHARMPFLSSEN